MTEKDKRFLPSSTTLGITAGVITGIAAAQVKSDGIRARFKLSAGASRLAKSSRIFNVLGVAAIAEHVLSSDSVSEGINNTVKGISGQVAGILGGVGLGLLGGIKLRRAGVKLAQKSSNARKVAGSPLGKVIFRRIGGRIVPIFRKK